MSNPAEQQANNPQPGNDAEPKRRGRRRLRRRRGHRENASPDQPIQAAPVVTEKEERRAEDARPTPKPRRRQGSRRSALPQFDSRTVVIRANAPRGTAFQPMRMRTIIDGDESEPQLGCPMLTRTRVGLPFLGDHHVPRCSAGWAVHDEDEVLLCMNTPSKSLCWKEHPEQVNILVEKLGPIIETELSADQ